MTGRPSFIHACPCPCRGLAVDTDKGLLLKLSYIHAIALRTVFRGRRRLTKEKVLAEYGGSGAWMGGWRCVLFFFKPYTAG